MLNELINTLIEYPCLLSFLATFLFGGDAVIILGFFSGSGTFPFWKVFIFSILGLWVNNFLLFMAGRINIISKLKLDRIKLIYRIDRKAKKLLDKTKSEVFLLMIAKFTYGIIIITMLYLGKKGMQIKKFLIYNTLIIVGWSLFAVSLGWFIGKMSIIALETFKNIYTSIILVITCLVIIYLVRDLAKRILLKVWRNK